MVFGIKSYLRASMSVKYGEQALITRKIWLCYVRILHFMPPALHGSNRVYKLDAFIVKSTSFLFCDLCDWSRVSLSIQQYLRMARKIPDHGHFTNSFFDFKVLYEHGLNVALVDSVWHIVTKQLDAI